MQVVDKEPVTAPAPAAEVPRVIKAISPTDVKWIGERHADISADAPAGTEPSDLEDPEFWRACKSYLNPRDHIRIMTPRFYAECVVIANDPAGPVDVQIIRPDEAGITWLREPEEFTRWSLPPGYRIEMDIRGIGHCAFWRNPQGREVPLGDDPAPTYEQARARCVAHHEGVARDRSRT